LANKVKIHVPKRVQARDTKEVFAFFDLAARAERIGAVLATKNITIPLAILAKAFEAVFCVAVHAARLPKEAVHAELLAAFGADHGPLGALATIRF
jgi:hypothetical protein